MTWFKVDDSFYDHPKVFDAPDSAVALWTRAGSWSARNLTDGFVPSGMLARFCSDPDTAARELVRRGLWSRTKDGFRFHNWNDYQPSRESVYNRRDADAERKRRQRKREKAQVREESVTEVSHRDSHVTHNGSHGVSPPPPTRPDPTKETPDGVSPPPAASQPVVEVLDAEIVVDDRLPAVVAENPENAGQLTRAWIDHCAANGVKLTGSIIKRYAVRIDAALRQGFPPATVRAALGRMLDDNEASRPSLLDNYLVRVQTGPAKGPRRMTPGEAAASRHAPAGADVGALIHDALTRPA